jgi:hypothetical protein
MAELTWTQRARRSDAVLLHLSAVEVLVILERYAKDHGLRPDGLTRAKDLLQRAAEMDPVLLPLEDQDPAYISYVNSLKLLATIGERPVEATERLKVVYVQVSKLRMRKRQDLAVNGDTCKLGGTSLPVIYQLVLGTLLGRRL